MAAEQCIEVREEIRTVASDLAIKIRILRGHIGIGSTMPGEHQELTRIKSELASLFEIPNDKAKIGFIVFDTKETDKISGWTNGKRIVQIKNPNADKKAEGVYLISLLPLGMKSDNLTDLGVSEIIPPMW